MGCIESTGAREHSAAKKPDIPRSKNNQQKISAVEVNVDEHARKAPAALRNSVNELIAYLSQPSREPRTLARAIFVWITENIQYDTDGFFGRTDRSPNDAESVMRNGKGVCAGYANVVETLCRAAGIPVKTISGYSKGYGSSAETQFSIIYQTNHAWNAIELDNKWHLIDSTWGAGHLDSKTNEFKNSFDEFYFLTDPSQFIYSHFPYMDRDMQASLKWQLLKKPVTLEEFNRLVIIKPNAFKLDVQPASHKQAVVKINGELEMSFKCGEVGDIQFSATLMFREGNMLYEHPLSAFGHIEEKMYKVRIHPTKTGTYHLRIFGGRQSDGSTMPELFEYALICEKVDDASFKFPYVYVQSQKDRCILKAPLRNNLKCNSAVEFHIISPYLKRVMVQKTFLEQTGTSFKGMVKTGPAGTVLSVYGSRNEEGFARLDGLYQYEVL